MSNPHKKPITRTVFIVEGIKTAVLVTTIAGRMRRATRNFETPEAALAWSRVHAASLVYSPSEPIAS
jgi:hypothetical protein